MEPIYVDTHIHTSQDANNPNEDYDVAALIKAIKDFNGNSDYLISLTDHNMINKSAYLKAKAIGAHIILGAELHIKHDADVKAYHCHIYFNVPIEENIIDDINQILDELYPNKLPERKDASIPDIQKIINKFDNYEFILLPHGSQKHGAFNYSIREGEQLDTAINRSIYYNQFDGFTARSDNGLENTRKYFEKLGIADFVNLLTCSDNYVPTSYPNTKAKDADEFVPTWMFAEPTFDGLRLSLSEATRLVAQREKPARRSEHIGHIYLKNETIDIDVHLTEGLNVVIGGSSSGKTLFVDSIYRAIKQNFDKCNYTAFRVNEISVDNPSNMHPYYVSQNFIAENINTNNERSIDKIEILHNIFPTDEEINQQITNALNNLNTIICEMIQCVSTIEDTSLALSAIPHLGRLIIKGKSKQNLIKLLLPDNETTKLVQYSDKDDNENRTILNKIKTFLSSNPFTESVDNEISKILLELEKASYAYKIYDKTKTIIDNHKKEYDSKLTEEIGEDQERKNSTDRLLEQAEKYVEAVLKFEKCKQKLITTQYSFSTKQIESMGHKLSISNNFKFNTDVLLGTLDHYLTHSFKSINDVTPNSLSSKHFKQKPKVVDYEDLCRKIYNDLSVINTKSYEITDKHGNKFSDLSPGWKTAIILDLILGYKDDNAPIIIDQPEDNLAVKYINSDLVKTIKEVKARKQVILVSHNATIPMMADAQNIIICRNEGNKITIRSASLEGAIKGKAVLEYIAEQTDGGKASIKKRVKKYNLKKFN